MAKKCSLLLIIQTGCGYHLPSSSVGTLSVAVGWPGRKADHSPPPSVVVKNGLCCTPRIFTACTGTALLPLSER